MQNVLLSLAVLACPLGMGAMMWFMARGMGSKREQSATPPSLETLREEHRRLAGEIERLEHDRTPSQTRS
jgi:hypothetical protein